MIVRSCFSYGNLLRESSGEVDHLPLVSIQDEPWPVDRCGVVHHHRQWEPTGPPAEHEIEACMRWFASAMKTKTTRTHSYRIKHVIERWRGEYVSNGAAIVAAYRAGVAIEFPRNEPSMNVDLGIGLRWLKKQPENDPWHRWSELN